MANTLKNTINELIRLFNLSRTLAQSGFNDLTITSATSLDVLQRNASGGWVNRQPFGTEANTTPVAGANDTVVGTTNRYYTFFTLPTTAPYFVVTGIEWLNGTVVAGVVMGHIEVVDANPPSSANTATYAWTRAVSQAGTSAVQRNSTIVSHLIPSGTLIGASIVSNNATARFGTTTVASANNLRAIALSTAVPNGSGTAWTAGTEEAAITVYYRPVMGV